VQAARGIARTLPRGTSFEEAKRALGELRMERRVQLQGAEPGPATVGELAAVYLHARRHLKRSTQRSDAQSFVYQVAPRFADVPPSRVRRTDVREWETTLREGRVSHRSVVKAVGLLRRLLAFAAEEERGWLSSSPLDGYRAARARTPQGEAVRDVLRGGEIDEVLAAAKGLRERTLLRAAVELLLRKGELLALTWRDLDLERGTVRVAWGIWRFGEGGGQRLWERQAVKGHQAQTLPLSRALAGELRAYRAKVGAEPDGFVWCGRRGPQVPLSDTTPNAILRAAIAAANDARAQRAGRALQAQEEIPQVRFHGLRHTGVTELLEAGLPLARVSQFARHKDARITATIYAHLSTAGLDEVASFWSSRPAHRASPPT
jgi:integrase